MRFNLVHVFLDSRNHGLSGYAEAIETVRWGLSELGHEVIVQTNVIANDRRNIIFGYQVIPTATLDALPPDSIIYNFEQMADVLPEHFRPSVHAAASRLRVWDYSLANIPAWNAMNPKYPPVHVPVGWSPTLVKIPRREQDIDVLIYGLPGGLRSEIFCTIASTGLVSMFVSGLYGTARDELIARSRIILNISRLSATRMFEVVRVSYLLANGKAVISDLYSNSIIEPDFRDAVAFATPDQIPALCLRLVKDESIRRQLEALGPQVMQKRDIRPILARALAQTP
jgi:hypothetical protein